MAVRQSAGLFDVSHMGEFRVRGPHAFDLIQHVATNDISRLYDGRALYTVMCYEDGGVVDDMIVYRLAFAGLPKPRTARHATANLAGPQCPSSHNSNIGAAHRSPVRQTPLPIRRSSGSDRRQAAKRPRRRRGANLEEGIYAFRRQSARAIGRVRRL